MKPPISSILGVTFGLMSCLSLRAQDKLPETLLATPGKLLLSEHFAKPVEAARMEKGKPPTSGWRLRPGKWEFVEGAMKGTELKADKHGAVARLPLAFTNVVVQYEVRLDGCRATTFSVNDAKEHVCRVLITPAGFSAQKDDHDHDGPDKVEMFGKASLKIAQGEWKTVTVEIVGDEMVARMDGKVLSGANPLIACEKANFGFTVSGEGASFRNLRIWEATANPDWAKHKAALSAAPGAKAN